MIRILNEPIYDEFMHLVQESNEEIKICAPFIKTNIINDIFTYKKQNVKIKTVTKIELMNFYRRVIDTEGLLKIITSDGIVYNYQSLHAKVYIFDNNRLIITSANLTEAGLKKNKEYGIITDERNLIDVANNDFNSICIDDITGKMKVEDLNKIQRIIDSMPKETKIEFNKFDIEYGEKDEIFSNSIIKSSLNFKGWKKSIYDIIMSFTDDYFEINDIYNYLPSLKYEYPNNNFAKDKARQILQQLRDLGLIRFVNRGKYLRLFK